MIYYFDKYFKSNSGIEMYSLSFCAYTNTVLFLIGTCEPWKINGAHSKQYFFATIRPHRGIFNEGKILMISLWLKTVIKRKWLCIPENRLGTLTDSSLPGQSRVESGDPAVSALKVQLKNSSSLVVPRAPQAGLLRRAGKSLPARECK